MRPSLRSLTLTSLVALGGLVSTGAENANAQLVVSTPGVTVGLGTPYVAYPSYAPIAPVVPLTPVYRPIPVRPVPYGYGRPGFYGPRPFGPRPPYGFRDGYGGGYRGGYRGGPRGWNGGGRPW
ncbi:hypothetical protein V5E97_03095 [Singulisphaera sp. Ch08]|uniref:Uncharacterized protein n=1 Tax=Singulisphaera sp. Ch08 TaxID=3120278 RepID=A0AAU7CID3_9BACT